MTHGCVMSKADDFRQYSDEALRSATESKSETQRQALMDLARTWTQAALKADAAISSNNPPKYIARSVCAPEGNERHELPMHRPSQHDEHQSNNAAARKAATGPR